MAKFSMPDKLKLAQLPTPVQFLKKLSGRASKFSETRIYVKRDDLTHGIAAGNKIRKLEYLFAEAISKKATTVVTCGGLQSNHARATAALARQLGLKCVLLLKKSPDEREVLTGNLLLDRIFDADIRIITTEQYEDIAKMFFSVSEELRANDQIPHVIAEGGSSDVGSLGYIDAVQEIREQATTDESLPDHFDTIVVANGSGGTHAGLLMGVSLHGLDHQTRIVSFNVCRTAVEMSDRVKKVALATIQRQRLPISLMPADIHVIDGYVGPGYGKASPELYDFIVKLARDEGILLDPVYTGKAMHGLVSELTSTAERAAVFGRNILFIHTGGVPSLSAYTDFFVDALKRTES